MNVNGNNVLEDDVPFCDPLLGDGELVGWIIVVLLAVGKRDMNPVPYKAAEI